MWRTICATMIGGCVLAGSANAQQATPPAREDAAAAEQRARAEADVARSRARNVLIEREMADEAAAVQRQIAEDNAAVQRRVWRKTEGPPKMETVAYCGVSTSPAAAVLTEQLRLARGLGLVVDFVEPGGPAEAAGVKLYDLVTHLDDQRLANPEQLRALVRLRKPGDAMKLTLIRGGQPLTVNVTLTKREVVAGADEIVPTPPRPSPYAVPGAPRNTITFTPADHGDVVRATGARAAEPPPGGGALAITRVNGNVQTVWSDDQDTLFLTLKDGRAVQLRANDRAGQEVFSGPVETPEQRKALPGGLAVKLVQAEQGGPLRQRGADVIADDFGGGLMLVPGGGGGGDLQIVGGGGRSGRPRVLTSQIKDSLMLARFEKGRATYVLAFSTADGKTLFDGPAATEEQRKAMPEAVASQLDVLEKNQPSAGEFGKM